MSVGPLGLQRDVRPSSNATVGPTTAGCCCCSVVLPVGASIELFAAGHTTQVEMHRSLSCSRPLMPTSWLHQDPHLVSPRPQCVHSYL